MGKDINKVCDGIERLLADTEFVRHVQWRVARIVNFCVNRIFNTSATNNIEDYANNLGKGIGLLWDKLPKLNDNAKILSYIHMPQAVLYLNSMGIRWRILERTSSERQYNLRIAVYHGEYFKKEEHKITEENYNREVFKHKSRHLLQLASRNSVPRRIVLSIKNGCEWLPDNKSISYPFSLITLPAWGGSEDQQNSLILQAPFNEDHYDKLRDEIFNWIADYETVIIEQLKQAGIEDINRDNYLLSIYNLYKLNLESRGLLECPTSHLVYLTDTILPNVAPSGYAGMLYVKNGKPKPDEYGRLIYLIQQLITTLFSQTVAKAETSAIQVALHKGLQSTDTWQMMFANIKGSTHLNTPLLEYFGPSVARLRDQQDEWENLWPDPPPNNYSSLDETISKIIRDRFVSFACPVGEPFETIQEVVDSDIKPGAKLETILCTPAFGYHALAREAYSTMVALWMNLHIILPTKKIKDGKKIKEERVWKDWNQQKEYIRISLLGLTEHLLFFEPTLHYIKSYRDHFLHSFNVLLLGYWLLRQKQHSGKRNFLILPNITGKERARLLRLWTLTAPLHDIAYPIEKIKSGTSALMLRYSKHGVDNFDLKVSPEWWGNLTLRHSYGFIHDVLRRVTDKSARKDKRGGPLFYWTVKGREDETVASTDLAAKLLGMLGADAQHGALAALILHNNLHEKGKVKKWEINRKEIYNLTEDDENDICLALAIHHILDVFDKDKDPDWRIYSDNHPLSYLLILCDTIAQWGRKRILDKDTKYETTHDPKETMELAHLHSIKRVNDTIVVKVVYHDAIHPDGDVIDGVAKFKPYYNRPFNLLKKQDGGPEIIKIFMHGYRKDPIGMDGDKILYDQTPALDKDNVFCLLT